MEVGVELTTEYEKICFVISPIGELGTEIRERSDTLFDRIIMPVLKQLNYTPLKGDRILSPGMIVNQTVRDIVRSPLVIADLTGGNPNVFYEVAIRHILRKPMIQMACIQKGEKIPFNISGSRVIYYTLDSVEDAKRDLEDAISSLGRGEPEIDTPISAELVSLILEESRMSDKDIFKFYHDQVFARPAFTGPYVYHSDVDEFYQAINDTIRAINTGILSTRDGITFSRGNPKSQLRNNEWKFKMEEAVRRLSSIEQILQQGKRDQQLINGNAIDFERDEIIKMLNSIFQALEIPELPIPSHTSIEGSFESEIIAKKQQYHIGDTVSFRSRFRGTLNNGVFFVEICRPVDASFPGKVLNDNGNNDRLRVWSSETLDDWSDKGKLKGSGDTGWIGSGNWLIPPDAPLGEYRIEMAVANTDIHNNNKKVYLNIVKNSFIVT